MSVGWPLEVDPDALGTVTCLEYSIYRSRIKAQCLADRFTEPKDEEIKPLADLAAEQMDQAWRTMHKITAVIEGRRGTN